MTIYPPEYDEDEAKWLVLIVYYPESRSVEDYYFPDEESALEFYNANKDMFNENRN